MAQSNGSGPRVAGGGDPPLARDANGLEIPLDPRFAQQPGQPGAAWQQQGQQPQQPQNTFGAQDPHALPPGYQHPASGAGHVGQGDPSLGGQVDPGFANTAGGPAGLQNDQASYAPQFAPYAQQAADPHQQHHQAPAPGVAHNPQAYPAGATPQTMENPAFPQQQPGQFQAPVGGQGGTYDDWPNTAPPQSQAGNPQVANAHGFDAGGYAGAQPVAGQPDYLTQPDYGPQTGQPQLADPFASQPGAGYENDPLAQRVAHDGGVTGEPEQGFEGEDYDDQYEDGQSAGGPSRTLLIVGVLVGAIAVGGGLAYGWKVVSGPGGDSAGSTPIVRGGTSPNKERPTNPGGQKFENADSKILGRLGDARSGTSATDANGTRKVPTVTITRDGRVQAPATAPTPSAGSEPVVSVPGLTIVDAFGAGQNGTVSRPATTTPATSKPIVVNPPTTQAPAKAKPRVQIRNVVKKAAPSVVTPKATAPAVVKKAATPAVKKKVAAIATPSTGSGGSKGYVAVLASVPVSSNSRMNALMKYADLQQKYGSVLANKTPDVREANLGSKGKYHRLLVGPPGSRAQASALCGKLKTAGYTGCWVTSY